MIRRHPHVFAKHLVADEAAVTGLWNRIKAEERAEKAKRRAARGENETAVSLLDAVPSALPALIQSLKLQQEAAKVGFDWAEAPPILDKIAEETAELREAMAAGDRADIAEEYGDLLFAMVNLGRHLKVDPEMALRAASGKFRQRFAHIETELKRQDRDIAATPLDDMEALWQQAKTAKAQN
jgi:ATP diphosphatase